MDSANEKESQKPSRNEDLDSANLVVSNNTYQCVGSSSLGKDCNVSWNSMSASGFKNLGSSLSFKIKPRRKVVNLSSQELGSEVINALNKDLGFAFAPKSIPVENIICGIEDGINNLCLEDKEALRQEFSLIMRKAKASKSNLSREEKISFRSLRNNDKIVVLKADKGGATMILDKEDYICKMNEHLSCGSYKKLSTNPIPKIMREVKMTI